MIKYSYLNSLKGKITKLLSFLLFSIFVLYVITKNIGLSIVVTEILLFPFFSPDIACMQDFSKQIRPNKYLINKKVSLLFRVITPVALSLIYIIFSRINILLFLFCIIISGLLMTSLLYTTFAKEWIAQISIPFYLYMYLELMKGRLFESALVVISYNKRPVNTGHLYSLIAIAFIWGFINVIALITSNKRKVYVISGTICFIMGLMNFLSTNILGKVFSIVDIAKIVKSITQFKKWPFDWDISVILIQGLLMIIVYYIFVSHVISFDKCITIKERLIKGVIGLVIIVAVGMLIAKLTKWSIIEGYEYNYVFGIINELLCDFSIKKV